MCYNRPVNVLSTVDMHCILKMMLWQVFDIDGLTWDGDFIVKACLVDLGAKPGPLCNILDRVKNRKHMYGAMLSAGGTCANGTVGWRDGYISDILRYIDDFEAARDTQMMFGLYKGSTGCLEHPWEECDVHKISHLTEYRQVCPTLSVASRLPPGLPSPPPLLNSVNRSVAAVVVILQPY